jgi:hypothetical protein
VGFQGVRSGVRVFGRVVVVVMLSMVSTVGVLAQVGRASASVRVGARALAPVTFSSTGAEQTYRVPAGVSGLQVQAVGANGETTVMAVPAGQPAVLGGTGGMVSGEIAVGSGSAIHAGATLYVEVGGIPDQVGDGGFNGGGDGAAGGGGATDLRTCSQMATACLNGVPSSLTRLIVAAGGGGTGDCDPDDVSQCYENTGPGGSAGKPGADPSVDAGGGDGGGAGSLVNGGGTAGGSPDSSAEFFPATPGTLDGTGGGGQGFVSGSQSAGGGGGGGGYFGGGGGGLASVNTPLGLSGSGGGGGANFASPFAVTGVSISAGDGNPRLVITPQPASAVGITGIVYNSPGPDTATNASLNAEQIRLTNHGATPRQMRGWRITDADRDVYRFGSLTLRPGASVTVHSGRGSDTRSDRYWNRRRYVWNNQQDLARLHRANGTLAGQCRYDNQHTNRTRC